MHILVLLIGAVVIAYFLFSRSRNPENTIEEVVGTADPARESDRRRKFHNRAEAAIIDAISDPRVAAAVLSFAIIDCDKGISETQHGRLVELLTSVAGLENPRDDLIFAEWATDQINDINSLNRRLSGTLLTNLNTDQRQELIELIDTVLNTEHTPTNIESQALDDLSRQLQLVS